MANLMGFRKVSKLPAPKGRSIYDPLLDEVRHTGGLYCLDTNDDKRAVNLTTQLRAVVKKHGYTNVKVGKQGTIVYVEKRDAMV
jgi:hypothetical protein